MNETIANQMFENEQSLLEPGDPGFNPLYKSPYIFKEGMIPLGNLRLRSQRRKIIPCENVNAGMVQIRTDIDSRILCYSSE